MKRLILHITILIIYIFVFGEITKAQDIANYKIIWTQLKNLEETKIYEDMRANGLVNLDLIKKKYSIKIIFEDDPQTYCVDGVILKEDPIYYKKPDNIKKQVCYSIIANMDGFSEEATLWIEEFYDGTNILSFFTDNDSTMRLIYMIPQ